MKETNEVKTPGFLTLFYVVSGIALLADIGNFYNAREFITPILGVIIVLVEGLRLATLFAAADRHRSTILFQLCFIISLIVLYGVSAIKANISSVALLIGSLVWPTVWLLYFCNSKKFKAYCGINTTKAASPTQNIQAIDEAVIFDETPAAAQIEQPRIVKPSLEETPPQPIPQKLPNFCKHCGTILPEGENYCEICKRTLYPDPAEKLTPHYCKYCGAQYNSQATFCPDCKKRVRLFRKPTAAEVKNAAFYISIVLNLVFILLFVFMLNKPNTAAQQPVQAQPQQNTTTSNNSAVYNAAKERAAEAKKLKEEENYAAFVKAHEYHNGMVFVKESGNYTYYHFTQSCSAIRNDLTKSVHITTMRDKEPCPLCFK